jgi:hypothetical protein
MAGTAVNNEHLVRWHPSEPGDPLHFSNCALEVLQDLQAARNTTVSAALPLRRKEAEMNVWLDEQFSS